ncbi:MAG: endo alpha-1,4 polygalactosaminidase [Hyphomicrobiaceae bacterium]|nr:endo alpha-1,4 polygalactosaminidase [Hyphomicrobiaceae bacterium]
MSSVTRVVASAILLAVVSLPATAQTDGKRSNPLQGAKSWAYQLNNLGPSQQKRITESPYDLVVVDYARSEAGDLVEEPLSREEVARMKVKPDGSKRLIIAYLSIGEAEDNRYYWKAEWSRKRPAWMGAESKEWKGNYLVKYWEPVWQQNIFGSPLSYVDRIVEAGFDGFYIDRADAYYRFGDTKQARDQMADFLVKLSGYIRSKKPEAGIMMQNAEELLDRPAVVAAIDAIAKEDLIYGITHREELNKKDDIDYSTKLLKDAQAAGKAIFVVEYLKNPRNIADARKRMSELGFVLYHGPRGLFEIAASPGAAGITPGPALDGVRDTKPARKAATPARSGKVQAKQ